MLLKSRLADTCFRVCETAFQKLFGASLNVRRALCLRRPRKPGAFASKLFRTRLAERTERQVRAEASQEWRLGVNAVP